MDHKSDQNELTFCHYHKVFIPHLRGKQQTFITKSKVLQED